MAIPELVAFVAHDGNCAATRIDARLGAQSAALYRFGILAGYAAGARALLRETTPMFGPELRTYGKAGGLDEALVGRWIAGEDTAASLLDATVAALQAGS